MCSFLIACAVMVVCSSTADAAELKPLATWSGGSTAEEDSDLWRKMPKSGVVRDNASWLALHQTWKFTKQLPAIDFSKEMVLVTAGPGPNKVAVLTLDIDEERNDITYTAVMTEIAGPGFVCHLVRVPKVDYLNGRAIGN